MKTFEGMKTFEIEFKRISYVTMLVDACTKEQAETWAWEDADYRTNFIADGADWSIESVTEVTK